ncbi:MAG: aminoglycoside 6-adenylyltransferase [Armatimonadota bacterium]
MRSDYENAIIQKFIEFGEKTESIRAMVLTSSLCNPNAPADILSDFDIEIFFEDPTPFAENDAWIEEMGFGPLMALWHWPNEWDRREGEGRGWMRMSYFQDGTKMDITLGYMDDLRKVSSAESLPHGYDIGYEVLLDKDGVTASMKPPKYQAYILKPPSETQYISRIESFWMNSTYVAKYLWRDDIVAAKWRLNGLADDLREALEWSAAMDRDWMWKPGSIGRGLDKALDPDTRRELIASYAGGDMDELWESLFRTTALYRRMAIKVGDGLGYRYLHDLDNQVSTLHQTLKKLDRQTATREELARLLVESH